MQVKTKQERELVCQEVTKLVALHANNMLADAMANHGEHMPENVRKHLKLALENLIPVMSGLTWRVK